MILKIMGENNQIIIVDKVEKILIDKMSLEEAIKDDRFVDIETSAYYDSCADNPVLRTVFRLMLQKEDGRTFRVCYVSDHHQVYLLNDEGKTIERIN
jgi:hypothetical protein